MKRKIFQPLDFTGPLDNTAPDPIDEAVASVEPEDDADLDIAAAESGDPFIPTEPAPTAQPYEAPESITAPIPLPEQEPEPKAKVKAEAPKPEPKPSPVAKRASESSGPAVQKETSLLEVSRTRIPSPTPAQVKAGGKGLYAAAAFASIAWLAVPAAFWLGKGSAPFNTQTATLVLLGLLAVGPVALIWLLAYGLEQGRRLAGEARLARAQADDMVRPTALAAGSTSSAVDLIRQEIDHAVAAAGQARHELITLREVLASETAGLVEAAASSARTAAALTQSVGDERRELSALTTVLEAQVEGVEEAIGRQTQLVTQATDLAEAQLREAEARLANSAAELATAAGEASGAAKVAGEDLNRQVSRLEAAGSVVVEQIQNVEDSLAEQRASLVKVAHELRAEQEGFGAEVESRQAQLSELLGNVRGAASQISESAQIGGEALKVLVENAADRFRDLGGAVAEERDLFSAEMLKSLGAISEAARSERDLMISDAQSSIEQLSEAAAQVAQTAQVQSEAARRKVDELSEASFSAGQLADAAFEARLAQARALIEQSASLVEDAGVKAGERLTQGLEAARSTVERLEQLLAEVEARTERLPADAQQRSEQIQQVVSQGVDQLLDAARRAADETQAIDATFQERVRRNYEMLSEAVRLMGVVGGAAPSSRPPRPRAGLMARDDAAEPAPAPAAAESSPALSESEAAGLRPRLRLTPEAIDEEVFVSDDDAPPPDAPAETPAPGDSLTWKQILTSVDEDDGAEAQGDDGANPSMLEEVRLLGIDPAALLPRTRTDEIAPVLQAGDQAGGREIVRQLAPAAMRRLSRRVLTDPSLRGRAGRFLKTFEGQIDDAAAKDGEGFAIGALLASDEGRVFLLIDSAVSDIS